MFGWCFPVGLPCYVKDHDYDEVPRMQIAIFLSKLLADNSIRFENWGLELGTILRRMRANTVNKHQEPAAENM